MTVLRTITFKLRLANQDCRSLLDTMRAYSEAFSLSAKWGFENQSWNKVNNHNATYKLTRQSIPELPSSLVQGARDCACEALKAVKCKTLPERKQLSAMRYNQRVITVNMIHGLATIASTKGRLKATFFVPLHYGKYLKVTTLNVLGIDRGIVNIAVCSDNRFFNSKKIKNRRARYAYGAS